MIYKMQDFIFSPITLIELQATISDTIKKELAPFTKLIAPATAVTELLTRKQAAKLLSVSLPTLSDWSKTGKITGYRIASRVRYKREELERSLSKMVTRR
jgi:excisionase family DNA binding protein